MRLSAPGWSWTASCSVVKPTMPTLSPPTSSTVDFTNLPSMAGSALASMLLLTTGKLTLSRKLPRLAGPSSNSWLPSVIAW